MSFISVALGVDRLVRIPHALRATTFRASSLAGSFRMRATVAFNVLMVIFQLTPLRLIEGA
jgi:hypothetical protein